VPDQPTSLSTVADGVARIEWVPGLHEGGFPAAVDVVRREVEVALVAHGRVEALVAPDDDRGQRVATWAGLRREGVMRGITVDGQTVDRIVYARLVTDAPAHEPEGFRALLNSFLPRKRAISQMLIRDHEERVLLCQLTYKQDWDLPGGVVEVGESPQLAVAREVEEELGLQISAGGLLLTDWLPPWGGWDDALCLVFDGGAHPAAILDQVVKQPREIRSAEFCTPAEVEKRCADFTARRIRAALEQLSGGGGSSAYTESGV
jgi:8-oxo-dGTP pyrophosphatase MutT (NUDIX family)